MVDDSRRPDTYCDHMRVRFDAARKDLLLAVALLIGVALQAALLPMSTSERVVTLVVGGAVCASAAIRRKFPLAVGLGVQTAMVVTGIFAKLPVGPVTIGWFCALYALAVWTSTRGFVLGIAWFAFSDVAPELVARESLGTIAAFTAGAVVVMVLLRRVVGDRDRRLRVAERERELATREATIEERARIARELHDVIAHHVSMMVIQAGAERRVLRPGQESTRDVLATIEGVGRSALTEMRRLVGILRTDEREGLAPQPGVSNIAMLVGQMLSAGLDVELRMEGKPRDIPVGIDLSAYRIVQEGLTNALKYAGHARTTVCVRYGVDSLEIEIIDDGQGRPSEFEHGGHGLAGMRERVALFGGTLDAGRRPAGGFAVHVLLPIQ
jgi:signal transduction histidine kinase